MLPRTKVQTGSLFGDKEMALQLLAAVSPIFVDVDPCRVMSNSPYLIKPKSSSSDIHRIGLPCKTMSLSPVYFLYCNHQATTRRNDILVMDRPPLATIPESKFVGV